MQLPCYAELACAAAMTEQKKGQAHAAFAPAGRAKTG